MLDLTGEACFISLLLWFLIKHESNTANVDSFIMSICRMFNQAYQGCCYYSSLSGFTWRFDSEPAARRMAH